MRTSESWCRLVRAEAVTPADIGKTFWRYRWWAVVLGLVGGPIVYGYSLFLPNQYTASTLVLVEEAGLPSSYARSTVTVDLHARLRTLQDQIESRSRLESVMDRYDLYRDASSWEVRLREMRSRLAIDVSGSDSFRIAFTHSSPEIAGEVTNTLADLFIDDSTSDMQRQSDSTAGLIESQLASVRADLDVKEQEISAFKAVNMGALPEQRNANFSALDRLQQQLSANASAAAAIRDRQLRLEQTIAAQPAASTAGATATDVARSLVGSGDLTSLETRLARQPPTVQLEAYRLQRSALLSRFTARHPDVQLVDVKIEGLQQQVADLGPDAVFVPLATVSGSSGSLLADQLADVQVELKTLRADRDEIQRQISELERRVARAPEVAQQLAEFERDREMFSKEHDGLVQRRNEAVLAGNLERATPSTNFKVVDSAVAPQRKSSPRRSFFLLAGFLGGAALGVVLGFAREILS